MCIVCEIKAELAKTDANTALNVMRRVELLAAVASGLLEMGDKVAERKGISRATLDELRVMGHTCFSDDPEAKAARDKAMSEAETESSDVPEGIRELGGLLGALFGAKVEFLQVQRKPGESDDEAIARAMAERGEQPTKH